MYNKLRIQIGKCVKNKNAYLFVPVFAVRNVLIKEYLPKIHLCNKLHVLCFRIIRNNTFYI